LTYNNKLVPDAVKILTNVFNDYSIDGLMSKDCCRRLIKKIAGDSILIINHKVDKIFENYDADKDENLKL
jgi:carbamate kinase